jgi:hypothetical protein
MLPVSLDCPFFIALSVFSNVYFLPKPTFEAKESQAAQRPKQPIVIATAVSPLLALSIHKARSPNYFLIKTR